MDQISERRHYTVYFGLATNKPYDSAIIGVSDSYEVIQGLAAGQYIFSVAAVDANGAPPCLPNNWWRLSPEEPLLPPTPLLSVDKVGFKSRRFRDREVTLVWPQVVAAPSYEVNYRMSNAAPAVPWTAITGIPPGSTSQTIAGLANSQAYDFKVGTGPAAGGAPATYMGEVKQVKPTISPPNPKKAVTTTEKGSAANSGDSAQRTIRPTQMRRECLP